MLSLSASILFDRNPSGINLLCTYILILLSYLTYQPAASIFLVPSFLLFTANIIGEKPLKIKETLLKPSIVFIVASISYFLFHKYVILHFSTVQPAGLEELKLTADIYNKVILLFNKIIPFSLKFTPYKYNPYYLFGIFIFITYITIIKNAFKKKRDFFLRILNYYLYFFLLLYS